MALLLQSITRSLLQKQQKLRCHGDTIIVKRALTTWFAGPALKSTRQQLCAWKRPQYVVQEQVCYSTLQQSSRTQTGRRRWTPVTIGLALCPIITFGLGTWQVQRLRWKVGLIESLEERMLLEAIPLPRKVNLDAIEDFEYRKVKVTGHYRHDEEMLLGPRTRGDGQPGYFLITPLERPNASKILVRRGWVPREKKDQSTRKDGLIEGEVTVEGLLRSGEQKASSFVPENKPEKNEWYSLDLETMAKRSDAQPIIVETLLDTPAHLIKSELIDKNIPVGRSPVVELRNNHKEYIVTWYSLCIATSAMLYILMRRPPPTKKAPQMLPRHV
ncbi:surf-like protein [Lobosporangium transversale]|uniref:SURF1-like protein n=1 Tax=Lobosporangium transversale TaxID=64571 RepID=A0A1Y2GWR3_9FUNG|nr:SURF1 family-domain-containing protein [Lobosporangium transversale]KAF9919319.1 surf-like protein [Lobosporangium transversale]ORZ26738.1 SURF1 family-domain-containing protein [Lobosporangium transversale]|eukprot:XP_021884501.1 SURF1 family-domain-containing protein [Lobosporangium transversale]